MSRPSTAQTSKNPTILKTSAWSKGPPQSSSTPSRSQSPAPSTPIIQTHSRRPSALSGVSIKDGVSVNRNNVGAAKQGSAVTFGSIDDVSAPISSSPANAPSIKPDVVKSFGSIDAERHETHVNGKSALSSRPSVAVPTSATSSSTPPPAVSISSAKLARTDIAKLFQNPSSAPSTQPSSDTSSPSLRSSGLPSSQPGSSSQPPQSSAPPQPSQVPSQQHFTPYRHPQSGPGSGPPRPSTWPARQVANGTGPRSQGGPNGAPSQINPAMSSPRLGPMAHNGQPPAMPPPPQMQPPMAQQIPVAWGGYYYQPEQHYYPQPGWYPPPHHHPPPGGPHGPPHSGIPMSPRNSSMPLQQGGAGTPTLTHATASSVHAPHPPPPLAHPSPSMNSISSPPPTPSTTTTRLNANSSTFAPRPKVVIKKADGTEVNIENLKGSSSSPANNASTNGQASTFRQGSPGGTPSRPSVRLESPEQRVQRLAELEKAKQAAERKVKEEEERKRKEEEERRRKEEEEKERIRKLEEEEKERKRKAEEEEKERIKKEAEEERARKEAEEKERLRKEEEEKERVRREEAERERLQKEEEERRRKEEEERRRKEEEERQRREEEEQKRKEEEERERLRKEEKERQRLEEERAAQAKEAEEAAKAQQVKEEGEITEEPESLDAASMLQDDSKAKEPLRINTSEPLKRRPGRLDLSNTDSVPPSIPSALATARNIDDINNVQYPEGISSPRPDLNANAKDGKFRYDRDFLMQFMAICKEKPDTLPRLDAIGLESIDQAPFTIQRGGSGRHRQASGGPPAPPCSGLGFGPGTGGFPKSSNLNPFTGGGGMGNFSTQRSKLTSEERFQFATGRSASVGGLASTPFGRPAAMQRTPSQGGTGGMGRDRVRSQRGKTRDGGKMAAQQVANAHAASAMNFEPVVPLKVSENRWDRKVLQADADSPESVDRKVRGLLNKLTMERFDSISDQIIEWANKSEKEKDGRTLIQVIRLVFEKATDEAAWSEMYARLCRKMMEQISNKVQDDGIKNTDGRPIAGGQLFRKYLLNRCQEDFERGWVQKEATAAAAASKATEDEAIKAANEKNTENEDGEVALYSDEYYAAQKAKRQGLGLIKFIGELFKLQMLTERIMHECVKKLLGNVDNPEEEEIESLCKLLTTVGSILDTQKAHAHMDVYFRRMGELTKSTNVSHRMQFMLQDVIELRERKWVARNAVTAPTTIAQVHEAAAKEKAAHEKEYSQRQISMSRGGSRRGGDRSEQPQANPEGWAVAGNAARPAKVDLSNFGKISNKQLPQTLGPGSVFVSKKDKRESLSRTSSSSNMFSMLQNAESGPDKTPEALPQRKRLALLPRTKPIESETQQPQESSEDEEATTPAAPVEMTDDQAEKKIKEDLKEFFAVRNLDEGEAYFTALSAQHHSKLVDKLVSSAVESKEADAKLVADLFGRAVSRNLCSQDALEQGFSPCAEIIDDIAIDAPKAFQLFAMMMKGAEFDEERRSRLASSMDSKKLLELLS